VYSKQFELNQNRPKIAPAACHISSNEQSPAHNGPTERANMTKNRRWLTSAIAESKKSDVKLPWARGARRTDWKAKVAARTCDTKLAASA
jgi:hypothetical protein